MPCVGTVGRVGGEVGWGIGWRPPPEPRVLAEERGLELDMEEKRLGWLLDRMGTEVDRESRAPRSYG